MSAASKPPVEIYSFFLLSLLDTVRVNIAECAEISYNHLKLSSAKEVLMFRSDAETQAFITAKFENWIPDADNNGYTLKPNTTKVLTAADVSSHALIEQTLAYATELDRIV